MPIQQPVPQPDQLVGGTSRAGRNLHYYHNTEGLEGIKGTGYASGDYSREYWTGLFGYGFGLCYATHSQFCGEMEYLIGHGAGRTMGVSRTDDGGSHTTFEVYLPSLNDTVLLDHDVSAIVFDDIATGTNRSRFRSIPQRIVSAFQVRPA